MIKDDMTMIIDRLLLDKVTAQAKASPRLRMNYNFHQSLDEKCHRFLNAVEPGTEVPIHKHPTKDETFVIVTTICTRAFIKHLK
jgi:cupin fold WbuC family metalloprotein